MQEWGEQCTQTAEPLTKAEAIKAKNKTESLKPKQKENIFQ